MHVIHAHYTSLVPSDLEFPPQGHNYHTTEREEGRRAEELGVEDDGEAGEEHRLFLPTPPFMMSAE